MKRVVFIAVCVIGFLGFTSCRSTAPCGLSPQTKQNQLDYYHKVEIIIAEANAE